MQIDSPTARLELIADRAIEALEEYPLGARRDKLVCGIANLDQRIAEGKQGMGLDYRKVTDE